MEEVEKMVGICGLYCGTCPSYLAYREHDLEQLRKTSETIGVPIEEIRCDGCLSGRTMPQCTDCRHGFRKCAAKKNVTWCFQCSDFPCDRLKIFRDSHIVDDMSHHAHVIDDLRYMREHGVGQWVQEQEKAARCPQCGKKLYWDTRECPDCHTRVR